MRTDKKIRLAGALLGSLLLSVSASAYCVSASAQEESLASVTEESQILPIPSSGGKYMLKSNGFYCLNANGTKDTAAAVHYFDHFVIDGTIFNGYYYHDESGKFKAADSHLVYMKQLFLPVEEGEDSAVQLMFDGFHMVNNLGKISAAPQVRYLDNININGTVLNGFYYFDELGRLASEGGIHYIDGMYFQEREFSGYYYFGGTGGVLSQGGTTPDGLEVDDSGKITDMGEPGIRDLKKTLNTLVSGYEGDWSIYVKDLGADEELVINDKQMASASLIKAFVMEKTYQNMETVQNTQAALLKSTPDSDAVAKKLGDLLTNMITVSDNESFNELVRLQTENYDFALGARTINRYLKQEGYADTSVLHTLAPSASASTGIGESNTTSVTDCGLLLERIYRKKCVSKEASKEMLRLLLAQENTTKVPTPLESGIKVANKTGENDNAQHDIAIVYGRRTDYIICVMSQDYKNENDAIDHIRSISKMVYNYLNW